VVGFGNTLRGDDGVGPEVAEMLAAELGGGGAAVVSTQQLLPELAEAVGQSDLVVFIDAAMDRPAGTVATAPLEASPRVGEEPSPGPTAESGDDVFSHGIRPADLLSLALVLYDAAPEAVVVSVGAENFEPGWGLSDPVVRAVPQAARAVMAAIEAAHTEGQHRA
jgi:hydrogenase maturation protease